MSPFDLIKQLFHLCGLGHDGWTVSVDDVRKGPVTRTYAKLEGQTVALDFGYDDGDSEHHLVGMIPLDMAGRTGGRDEFTFDKREVEHDDFVLSTRFVFPRGPILVAEFKFEDDGRAHRIRFDRGMDF